MTATSAEDGKEPGRVAGDKNATPNASTPYAQTVILSYCYVFLWISLSFSVIIFNKYILDRRLYDWPFPISLTLIHMAFCSFVAFVIVRVFRWVDSVPMTVELYGTSVVPIGALFALSLWFSNSAYIYLSVSFIQMLKALMPVVVYLISVLASKESFRNSTFTNMLLISFGVAIAAYGEANFNFTGISLQLGAIAVEATRLVLIQILLTSKGVSLNPITSLYYISPCCFLFLLIPWFAVEYPKLFPYGTDAEVSTSRPFMAPLFLANCCCAFFLNCSVFLLIGKTSALTMNVAGVVKDWLLIAFSWSVIADTITAINLIGYAIAFAGVCWYNNQKLKEMKAKNAGSLESVTTADSSSPLHSHSSPSSSQWRKGEEMVDFDRLSSNEDEGETQTLLPPSHTQSKGL